jgi:ATP-binding cassette, subfamily A (ABC1), member 3
MCFLTDDADRIMLLLYMTAIMNIQAQGRPETVQNSIRIVNYTFTLVSPVANLMRALIISLNIFSTLCSGSPPSTASYAGAFELFGQPVVYLIGQCLFMFGLLLLWDNNFKVFHFKRGSKRSKGAATEDINAVEATRTLEPEVSEEIVRASNSTSDGLRVLHLSKSFKTRAYGRVTAVDDVTFGVKKNEILAIAGPNGAGKSTTITMLRGDLSPSNRSSEVEIANISVLTDKKAARAHLGVCPQFDAMDQMTVLEHLKFYAGVRGVPDVESAAARIISAVGLEKFKDRMGSRLSGGNQRKLSLGIALIGNPPVVLLDEPSSGMDPISKRLMWSTLHEFVPNRSILLTTHSMEEADHLANRVGVVAKRMLDLGSTKHLRQKHGWGFHIHIVLRSAPRSEPEEMDAVVAFMREACPGSEVEGLPYHGQLRFSIPVARGEAPDATDNDNLSRITDADGDAPISKKQHQEQDVSVGSLFMLLEQHKEELGIEFYSVSPSTFDEVFLRVVGRHSIQEEDRPQPKKKNWKRLLGWPFVGRRQRQRQQQQE